MKTVLIGLESSGSETFFEILSHGQAVQSGKKNIGASLVPDPRVNDLSASFKPKKTSYASLQFSWIDSSSSSMYEDIRGMDCLVYVMRTSPLYDGEKIDPLKVYDNFLTDLKIKDLDQLDRFIQRNAKDLNKKSEVLWAKALFDCVENSQDLSVAGEQALKWSLNLGLVSNIPRFVILNANEEDWKKNEFQDRLKKTYPCDEFLQLSLALEKDIALLEPESRKEMLDLYQIEAPVLDVFLRKLYDYLGWMTFFTVGEDEVKAWTIKKGATAFEAAGKIHSDIQRGFIRAEVVHYDDFKQHHFSFKECKDTGCFAVEGKQYIVLDGDIVHFRFNI
jgi:ribosome-binding ATPase